MLCAVLGEEIPPDIDGKRKLCLANNIALWDVLASCDINGAADSSIANAEPNDIRGLLEKCPIRAIFTTGKKAHALYKRFFPDLSNRLPVNKSRNGNCCVLRPIAENFNAIKNAVEQR